MRDESVRENKREVRYSLPGCALAGSGGTEQLLE